MMSDPRPLPNRLDPRRGASASPTRRVGAVLRALAAALSVLLLVGSGWVWYLRGTAEQNLTRTDALPASGNTDAAGTDGGATNILLVGSDSRAGATDQELAEKLRTGDSGTMNTDTMLVVHIPSDGSRASVVSFPRDSYVEIPGFGESKLNAAYALGFNSLDTDASQADRDAAGAQLLVQTISSLSGVQIDHYVQVDLIGFYDLTQVIGGVEVNLCAPARDSFSGIDLPAGVQTISGADALAFVRQRNGLPNGDLDRIVRQQAFIGGVVRNLLSAGVLLNPLKQRDLVEAASQSLTVDANLDLLDLAQQLQNLAAGNVEFSTVPIANPDGNIDGSSVVLLEERDVVVAFFAQLSGEPDPPASTDTATVDPAEVTVDVFNGSGVGGLGADTQFALEQLGYGVSSVGDADRSDYTSTEIRYAPDLDAEARTLALVVPGAQLVELADLDGQVQLVIGADFAGIGQATPPPAADPPSGAQEQPRTAADTACIN
ncbi:MAG: LCP family protein [Geodermatophilaceae bacterium]|nr:LCP family protein [Geodermatophilaceae bacterium]